jgi:serine/threonine protein kinase
VVRELRIYKRCQQQSFHPNIVALYDAFYAEGRVYMVLELMTWGSLDLALCNSRKKYLDNKKAQRSEGKRHEVISSRASSRQQANEEDSEQHGYAEACSTSSPLVDMHVSGCSDEGTSPRRSGGKRRGWAMEEPVLVEAAGCILHALNFLHRNYDIVHRDIKPGNVMLSRDGSVKISDFGVSMIHSADDCDRVAGSWKMTFRFQLFFSRGFCWI